MSMRTTVVLLAVLAVSSAVAPRASATPPIFNDDFQTGIQPSNWGLYPIGGTVWAPFAESNNGMIRSPAQPFPVWPDPRQDNILTPRDDFSDFVVTWNMRFLTEGQDQDYRFTYLRCDNAPTPHGYWVGVGVSVPPAGNRDVLFISAYRLDGSSASLADVDYAWDLGTWYRFKARCAGSRLSVRAWRLGDPEPSTWNIDVVDPMVTFTQGRIGFGDYWRSVTDVDNVVVSDINASVPALPLRNPQISLNGSELQQYLDGLGESINVFTDQLDAQVWTSSVSGNATFTLMVELAGNAAGNSIGVYNTLDPPNPPLFQIFPGAAQAGWFATCHFGPGGSLAVLLYDQNAIFQGQTNYVNVNRNHFGFYLQGPGGTFYSQDSRNGGNAQMLTYLGTGQNFGDWWECFEDLPWNGGDRDFDDAVLLLQSVTPTPARTLTWGALKALYR